MEIVITTIFPPTKGARELALGLQTRNAGSLWVIGDRKGPREYELPHTSFFPIDVQGSLGFELTSQLKEGSYARKNLGYLLAMRAGAACIAETDDDNIPLASFWGKREPAPLSRAVGRAGWFNVYRAFSSARIWPRGFPLEALQGSWSDRDCVETEMESHPAYIQQGLANENPDVDAVYRLVGDLPVDFEFQPPVFLGDGVWCPFNSQNTTFFPAAYPLLYLPTYCSFRMTDIWRSFVAQRCLWAMGSGVMFHGATVYQERNEHSLLRDFEDEVSGYLLNERIRKILANADLHSGTGLPVVTENFLICYEALIREGILPPEERSLVFAWTRDVNNVLLN